MHKTRLVGMRGWDCSRTWRCSCADVAAPPSIWCSTDRPGPALSLFLPRPEADRRSGGKRRRAQGANPGARIPRGRLAGFLTIAVDTREKYAWKFADRALVIER